MFFPTRLFLLSPVPPPHGCHKPRSDVWFCLWGFILWGFGMWGVTNGFREVGQPARFLEADSVLYGARTKFCVQINTALSFVTAFVSIPPPAETLLGVREFASVSTFTMSTRIVEIKGANIRRILRILFILRIPNIRSGLTGRFLYNRSTVTVCRGGGSRLSSLCVLNRCFLR